MTLPPIQWGPDGLIPAVVQDVRTGQVLMVAYMNEEALARTLATGETWFWSRSRRELWHKGATSGHVQKVREIRYDCDADTLLVLVEQAGAACHEGTYSCFARRLPGSPAAGALPWVPALAPGAGDEAAPAGAGGGAAPAGGGPGAPGAGAGQAAGAAAAAASDPAAGGAWLGAVLADLAATLEQRRRHPDPESYTSRLFQKGIDAPLKKVAEEAGEVILAAKGGDRAGVVWEVADLWFHSLVVLTALGISPGEVAAELARRRGQRRPAQ